MQCYLVCRCTVPVQLDRSTHQFLQHAARRVASHTWNCPTPRRLRRQISLSGKRRHTCQHAEERGKDRGTNPSPRNPTLTNTHTTAAYIARWRNALYATTLPRAYPTTPDLSIQVIRWRRPASPVQRAEGEGAGRGQIPSYFFRQIWTKIMYILRNIAVVVVILPLLSDEITPYSLFDLSHP